jgi:hypothetical protein
MDKLKDKYGSQFGGVGCAELLRETSSAVSIREEESTAAGCYQILSCLTGRRQTDD